MYNLDEYVLPNRNSLGISFSSFAWLYSFNNKYDGWRGFYYHSSYTYFSRIGIKKRGIMPPTITPIIRDS